MAEAQGEGLEKATGADQPSGPSAGSQGPLPHVWGGAPPFFPYFGTCHTGLSLSVHSSDSPTRP